LAAESAQVMATGLVKELAPASAMGLALARVLVTAEESAPVLAAESAQVTAMGLAKV